MMTFYIIIIRHCIENMIIELLTIGAILASCGLLTWSAMQKYQTKIESRLEEIESRGAELEVTERRYK